MVYQYVLAILVYVVLGTTKVGALPNPVSAVSPTVRYQFELTAEQKAKLTKGLATIKIGDTITAIKKVLGKPTHEYNSVSKGGQFISRVLKYDVARVDKNLVNMQDHLIMLDFDANGHLVKIYKQ